MKFVVIGQGQHPPKKAFNMAYLIESDWDDWFRYETAFVLEYHDLSGGRHRIGEVKIAQFGMGEGMGRQSALDQEDALAQNGSLDVEARRWPDMSGEFRELGPEYFSLGQDDRYYERLNELGAPKRTEILTALRDVARDEELFTQALEEPVTAVSLLRSVERATVEGQFRRMTRGGARLTAIHLTYTSPESSMFAFRVRPESQPPTNIHVVIGRNGVGKTRLLRHMTKALTGEEPLEKVGRFRRSGIHPIANVVFVSFSAFDPFVPITVDEDRHRGISCRYVGLKRLPTPSASDTADTSPPDAPSETKSWGEIAEEFAQSLPLCLREDRRTRWRKALETLETDHCSRPHAWPNSPTTPTPTTNSLNAPATCSTGSAPDTRSFSSR